MRIHDRWKTVVLVLVGLAVLAFLFAEPGESTSLPDQLSPGNDVSPGSEVINADRAIEFCRSRIRENPDAIDEYVILARLYQQKARFTARHHAFLSRAQVALDEALSRDPENFNALLEQASVWLTLHQFERAKKLAKELVARNRYKASAWGVYSDALKELGEYQAAIDACDEMLNVRPDLRSYARAAHLRELHGDLTGARQAMRLAVDAGVVGLESHAWALTQLGNLCLASGSFEEAVAIFRAVLAVRTDYPQALAGLGRAEASRGNFKTAEQRFLHAYRIAPEHEFMEELVHLYQSVGDSGKARVLTESVLQGYRDHESEGWNVNLEYSMFCLRLGINLEQSLARMEKEFKRRPKHIEVVQTLAWARQANGR